MSPELRINKIRISLATDTKGPHDSSRGKYTLDLGLLNPHDEVQEVALEAPWLAGRKGSSAENGRRIVQIGQDGRGAVQLSKDEILEVIMNNPLQRPHVMSRRERRELKHRREKHEMKRLKRVFEIRRGIPKW